MAASIPALGATIEVVDRTGKVWSSGNTIFRAIKDAKAAYHARKAEILAERAMQRAKETTKLAALEKEVRRTEKQRKRLEHQKRVEEREKKKQEEQKAIEWKESNGSDTKNKDKEKKKKEKKERSSSGKELVLYGESKDRREKEKKEKKDKKEEKDREKKRRHQSSDRKRKGSASSTSSSNSLNEEESSTTVVAISPPSPPPEDELKLELQLQLAENSLSPSPPVDYGAAARVLGLAPHIIAMIDPNGDSPLSALLLQLTNILDTLDCLNASYAALMATLEKDPQALAAVGLLFAQISAIVAKTAPAVILAAKAAFPFIFSLLATPQFLVTAGAGVIILGGYKIIRRITGGGSAPAVDEPNKEGDKAEDDDHLAYGPGAEDLGETDTSESRSKRVEGPRRALTLPAPSPSSSSSPASNALEIRPAPTTELPPSPPKTPTDEKDPKKGKRQTLKRFFTTVN